MPTSTGTRAPLEDRLDALVHQFVSKAWREDTTPGERQYLLDHAASLAEFAEQVREEYVRVAGSREPQDIPTLAQGVALAWFLRGHFRHPDPMKRLAYVTRGSVGLPEDFLHVRFGDGYEGGIAPDGRTST
jgi:hypothetical protein